MERCNECGFVYDDFAVSAVAGGLRSSAERFRSLLLAGTGADWETRLRQRPDPKVWSPLEYACHVRDVFLVQRDRLYHILVEDCPTLSPMHREERVGLARYNEDEPATVAAEIEFAGGLLARSFERLDETQWQWTCVYSYPAPTTRTVAWVGRQTMHEAIHHALDISRLLNVGPSSGSPSFD
ncbi:MAG: DinB family protein [Chloroflexota bacterium]|nr:DinB family protein [Chloroflexota bacterium]